jgi:hypothetical protein
VKARLKKFILNHAKVHPKIGHLPKKLFSQAKLFSPACLPAVSTKE